MKIEIEKLIYGGYGLSRTAEKVVFVKGGVPGDKLEVQITENGKSFDVAEIIEVTEPSFQRTEPVCKYFGRCGGCQWQHIEYSTQLEEKTQILRESLMKITGLDYINIEPITASEDKYNYRNRVTLHLETVNKKHLIGFKEEKSHELVHIDSCDIADNKISKIINTLSKIVSSYEGAKLPFDTAHITSLGDAPALSLSPHKDAPKNEIDKLLFKLKERMQGADISIADKDEKTFRFEAGGLKFISSPSLFTQCNTKINNELLHTIYEWADLQKGYNVLDLYCGYGNLTLNIARRVKQVLAVDSNKKAIAYAIKNAKLNSIRNCWFEDWDVYKYLQRHKPVNKVDLVIIDPPRTGAKQIIKPLLEISPAKIIYVSCNPTTLARDIKQLLGGGYVLSKVKAFDMFPQTYHLESLVLLEKELE